MNIEEYKKLITTNGFDEYPSLNDGKHLLSKFLSFKDIDIDLKIYLSVLILCRSYYGTYTAYYNDVKWFLEGFFQSFEGDLIKPFLTEPIKLSAELILSEDAFSKGIVGNNLYVWDT